MEYKTKKYRFKAEVYPALGFVVGYGNRTFELVILCFVFSIYKRRKRN